NRKGVPNLVLRQASDEMPAQPRGEERDLGPRFLHAAVAEKCLARPERGLHFLGSMRLRDRDQLDVVRGAPALLRSRCDLLVHELKIGGDFFHRRIIHRTIPTASALEAISPNDFAGSWQVHYPPRQISYRSRWR